MNSEELEFFFRKVLLEELDGCELSINEYYLALKDEVPVGGVAAWLEQEGFKSSNYVRAMLYAEHLSEDKWKIVKDKLDSPPVFNLEREVGELQVELTYIKDSCSGSLTVPSFNIYVKEDLRKRFPAAKKIQLYTLFGNVFSFLALAHLGYKIIKKIEFDISNPKKTFLGKGRILWEKKF